jgi:tripeptide aminopeptidase
MVNSQLIAMEFQSLLPAAQRPEHTEGYEGFFHLIAMEGSVENSTLRYIIRDHDMEKFKQKKEMMSNICHFLNEKYGKDTVHLEMSDSYFNMRGQIEPCMHIVHRAVDAMKRVGIEPKIVPIRGGTDGAKLSFMGLPCPNLCTGGQNFHGKFEYIPLEDMEKVVELLLAILEG